MSTPPDILTILAQQATLPSQAVEKKSADKTAEVKAQEHVSTGIWDDIKQVGWNDLLAPAYNTGIRVPINTALHGIYGLADKGVGHEHILPEADTSGAGEVGKTIQALSSGTVGVVELCVAAKFGSKLLRAGGELIGEEKAISAFGKTFEIGKSLRTLAASRKAGLVAGATIYEAAKDPDKEHGETRLGNVTGLWTSLAIYEGGNKLLGDRGLFSPVAVGSRAVVGVVAGQVQSWVSGEVNSKVNHTDYHFQLVDRNTGIRTALTNVFLPAILKAPEVLSTRSNSGVYADEFAKSQHEAAKKALKPDEEAQPGTWAHGPTAKVAIEAGRTSLKTTVKTSTTEKTAFVDQSSKTIVVPRAAEVKAEPDAAKPKPTIINRIKGVFTDNTHQQVRVSPADFIEENAHIKVAADPKYEKIFTDLDTKLTDGRSQDAQTQSRTEAEVNKEYIDTRVTQEKAARIIRNDEMAKVGATSFDAETDEAVIRQEYGARFAQEAKDFVEANRLGKRYRPPTDHSYGGTPSHPSVEPTPVHPAGDSPPRTAPSIDTAAGTGRVGDVNKDAPQTWPKPDEIVTPKKEGQNFQLWWKNGTTLKLNGIEHRNVTYAEFDSIDPASGRPKHIWMEKIDPQTRMKASEVHVFDKPVEWTSFVKLPDGKQAKAFFTYTEREQNVSQGFITYRVAQGKVGDSPRALPDNCLYEIYSARHQQGGAATGIKLELSGHEIQVDTIVRQLGDPQYEQTFTKLETQLKASRSRNPEVQQQTEAAVKTQFKATRLQQEIAARTSQNENLVKYGNKAGIVSTDPDVVGREYQALFTKEANDFVDANRRGEKFRPVTVAGRVDYGIAGSDGFLTEYAKPQIHGTPPEGLYGDPPRRWEPGDPLPPNAITNEGRPTFYLYQQEMPQRDGSVTRYMYDPRLVKKMAQPDGSTTYAQNTELTPEQRKQIIPSFAVDIHADGSPNALPKVESQADSLVREYPRLADPMANLKELALEVHSSDDPGSVLQKIYKEVARAEQDLGGPKEAAKALKPLRIELRNLIGGQEVSFKIIDESQAASAPRAGESVSADSKKADPYREVSHGHFVEIERSPAEIKYLDGMTGVIKIVKFGGEKLQIETRVPGMPETPESRQTVDAIDEEYPEGRDTAFGVAVSTRIEPKSTLITLDNGGTVREYNRASLPDGFPTPWGNARRIRTVPALPDENGKEMVDTIYYREDVNKGETPYTEVTVPSRVYVVPGTNFVAYAREKFPGVSGTENHYIATPGPEGKLISNGVLTTRRSLIATNSGRDDLKLGSADAIWRLPGGISILKRDGSLDSGWSKKIIAFDAQAPSVITGPDAQTPLDLFTDPFDKFPKPDLFQITNLGENDIWMHDATGRIEKGADGQPIPRPILQMDYIVPTAQSWARAFADDPLDTNGLMTRYGLALDQKYYANGNSVVSMQDGRKLTLDPWGNEIVPPQPK
jgi:hypothetical protein